MRRARTIVSCVLVGCGAGGSETAGDTGESSGGGTTVVATTTSTTATTTTTASTTDATTAVDTSTTTDADASSDDGTTGWIPPADCGGGALADLAAEIAVGEFVELPTVGLDADLIDAGGGHHVMQFSDKGVWDPNTCQALFTGGGHLSLVKFLAYSASENTWFHAPNPTWWCETTPDEPYACATHAYGANALDPATGSYWFRGFNSAPVHHTTVVSPISETWDAAPALPGDAASCIATSLEYFPELGGLVYVDCTGQTVLFLPDGGDAWETLPGNYPMGAYHNYAVYSAGAQSVLFGAGNDSFDLYLLDAAGVGTQIAAPPYQFHPSPEAPDVFRILTADPISGRFLAYTPGGELHEYDAGTDAWSMISDTAPTDLQIAIPVSTYGVVLFVSLAPSMYVYRHVAG